MPASAAFTFASVARAAAVAAVCIGLPAGAFAQPGAAPAPGKYPVKSVRMILAFPPGGASDFVGRLLAQRLAEIWGQSVPAANVKELIALARAKPGALNYASSGSGLAAHLAGELFTFMTSTSMVHVPYKGAGPALSDLFGGQTQLMFATATSVVPHVKAGKLRALATTGPKRSVGFEDMPSVSESGGGFDATS